MVMRGVKRLKTVRLGSYIRGLRLQKGLTQQALAEKLHVTDKAVSKWERGLSLPDIFLFPGLAAALGVSTGDLLLEFSEEEETPSSLVRIYEKAADVRTPLHIILGCVDLIGKHRDDQELADRYLESIRISGEYLLSLLNQVRDAGELKHLLSQQPAGRSKSSAAYSFAGKRFLVAEDIEVNREIAAELLKDTGAAVELAEDGQICVDMVSAAPPGYYDLIFMDINMPNMDGLAATRRLRQMGYTMPIIAMTANVSEQDKKAALDAGMDAFTEKPIFADLLFSTVHGLLHPSS